MAGILVVCTGNVCRSPIAEGLLRAALAARLGDAAPRVTSAGTMGWEGSGADPHSVEAAAERGVDISAHRARMLRPSEVEEADLVLAMAREHEEAVRALAPGKAFTLKELVRLLEALPAAEAGDPDTVLADRIARADTLRRSGYEGNPHDEDVHWRNSYQTQPYYTPGYTYDDYAPAYALGYNSYGKYPGNYDANESHLSGEWDRVKGNSRLSWEQAKQATRAAWHKVERALPGDADGDGR